MQRIKLVCPTCGGETYKLTNGTPEYEILATMAARLEHSVDHDAPVIQRREDVPREDVLAVVWDQVMGT